VEKISKHITLAEATKSQTAKRKGINNEPDAYELQAMKLVAEKIFEPIREHFNVPISVTSFFRSKRLNTAIGGSATSQHCTGEAMDLDADVFGGVTNKEIFDYIKNNLEFDQLICEFPDSSGNPSWVHVSYSKINNRKQILKALKGDKRTIYLHYD